MKLLGVVAWALSRDERLLIESTFRQPIQIAARIGVQAVLLILPCGCLWKATDIGETPGDFSIEHVELCAEPKEPLNLPATERLN